MNIIALTAAANDLATEALPFAAYRAAAILEGATDGAAMMRDHMAARRILAALAAHCLELNDLDSGAAAERERVAHEARMARVDEIRARRAAALAVPALMILSSRIAVSVAPAGDALHAAHLRHSVGEDHRCYTRTPDGRVSASRVASA